MRRNVISFCVRGCVGPILHWMSTCPVSRWLVGGRRLDCLMVEYFRKSFRPRRACSLSGLTPNQKSMAMAITSGDQSLEVMKRRMRRTPQPCVKMPYWRRGEMLKAHQTSSGPDVNADLNRRTPFGEAQAAPKKNRKKRKKKRSYPSLPLRRTEPPPPTK